MSEPASDDMADPAGRVVVDLDGVISLLGRFPALSGLNLSVRDSEIVLLRGPNGAGKTTLLRLCAGLAPLSGGTGRVLGYDLSVRKDRRRLRRESGLLSHQTFLYDELTVEENLKFWAQANRVELDTIEPVLDRLDLAGRLRNVSISALSTGQRRRASLAVMVCRRPKLWLLDEPHAGLDQAGRDFVDDIVRHAVRFGATVMLASHDLDRSIDLASRVVQLAGGQLVGSDSADSAVTEWAPAPGYLGTDLDADLDTDLDSGEASNAS